MPKRACEACKRKKIRCDMLQPSCGLCTRTNNRCLYRGLRGSPASRPPAPRSGDELISTGMSSGFINIPTRNQESIDTHTHESDDRDPGLPHVCPSISSQLKVPAEVITDLVELFFSHIQPWLPIFHKPTFLQSYMREHEGLIGLQNILSLGERLIFYSMFALSARFSGLPYFAGVSPTDRGKSFAMEAIQMYDSCRRATGKPNLHLLQGSILLAFFFHTTGPSSRAWMLTGMVIRLAYELEIEKTDQVGRRILVVEDWIQIEEIRRAWWLVWELDTFASITCNRPYAIPREEVAVFLPISDENWFSGTFTASTTLKTSPEEAWKSLDGSKNQNPRAWFLVANHLASLALGPQSRNQQDQLTMDLSINCFRFALPKAFHPPLQRLITSEQMAERNWVICTYLTLSAHRVLHGSAGVSVTASTDFLHRVHSLQAFNAELAYIVDCWPTNAITVCQPLISCTLLASHHILWKVPDSLQDPSIRLGRALVDEILKRFAATWEIGMNLLKAIKAYQTAGSLTPEEEDLLSRLSRYIPNSPSSSRLVSMGPQLSHASNFQLNFQPELEDFTGNINPPHNCDGTSENSGSHRMTRDPSVDIFSFLDNSIDM